MESKNMHTPGPWEFSPSRSGGFVIAGRNKPDGYPVLPYLARTMNFPKEHEANARLIAAAPNLLEALEWLIEDVEYTRSDFVGQPTQVRNSSVAMAKAAIAKARGQEAK